MEIRGVERLSFRERQVVALKETGHGNRDIARQLGVSTATVATLFHRAKAKGYEVVLVLSGDPLNLYPGGDDSDQPDSGESEAKVEGTGPVDPAPDSSGSASER